MYDWEVNVKSIVYKVEVYVNSTRDEMNKKVIIEVADENANFDIECDSGNVTVENMVGNNIEVSCENGNIEAQTINFNIVSLDSSNGNIDAELSG